MKILFTSNSRRRRLRVINAGCRLIFFLFCGGSGGALTLEMRACGPDFPNRYLDATEERLLVSPEAIFASEVERIAAQFPAADGERKTAQALDADAKDLIESLGKQAVQTVEETLPENARTVSPVLAAYRLGRVAAAFTESGEGRSDDARRVARGEAVSWFQLTRALIAAGAEDDENLASESIGWEAFAEFHTGNFVRAISLYLEHHRRGDPTAVSSLRFVMRRLFRDDTWRNNGLGEKLANDPQARQVWTAWLLAQGDPYGWEVSDHLQRVGVAAQVWAELLNKAGVCEVAVADRFAWVAYQGGSFALAQEWVRLAPRDSGAAEWIRAKLALRSGDLLGGERHLRAALSSRELAEQRDELLGELGRVCLARDCGKGALTAWLDGGHWEDAAYVAERVMTLEELRVFVDGWSETGARENHGELRGRLRHLLARRLMRANRADDAAGYFPEELRGTAAAYVKAVRAGFEMGQADAERAAAFWRAAQIARGSGMELLGTELEPDWAIWGGSFDTGSASEGRVGPKAEMSGTFAATTDEVARVTEHVVPEQRFHYRYRAAQLAWWAAALMPNDAEETAAILAEAGGWLKGRDPKAAKVFYEALAIRCGRTELGKAALARRWFPEELKAPDS